MSQATANKAATRTEVRAKVGVVSSDKRDKTRKVVVSFQQQHPKYGKFLKKRTVLHAHDAKNESRSGDTVEVRPCPPVSKTKRWEIVRVLERGSAL